MYKDSTTLITEIGATRVKLKPETDIEWSTTLKHTTTLGLLSLSNHDILNMAWAFGLDVFYS